MPSHSEIPSDAWLELSRAGFFDGQSRERLDSARKESDLNIASALFKENGRLHPYARYHRLSCPYCKKPMLLGTKHAPTREHVVSRARGGKLTKDNKLIVCGPCNNDKGNMTLEQFVRWLTKRSDPRAGLVRLVLNQFKTRHSQNEA